MPPIGQSTPRHDIRCGFPWRRCRACPTEPTSATCKEVERGDLTRGQAGVVSKADQQTSGGHGDRVHALRHFYASALLDAVESIRVLAEDLVLRVGDDFTVVG